MATKYECDRCATQTTNARDIGKVSYPELNYNRSIVEDGFYNKDLCSSCVYQLHDWLKPLPKVMSK